MLDRVSLPPGRWVSVAHGDSHTGRAGEAEQTAPEESHHLSAVPAEGSHVEPGMATGRRVCLQLHLRETVPFPKRP